MNLALLSRLTASGSIGSRLGFDIFLLPYPTNPRSHSTHTHTRSRDSPSKAKALHSTPGTPTQKEHSKHAFALHGRFTLCACASFFNRKQSSCPASLDIKLRSLEQLHSLLFASLQRRFPRSLFFLFTGRRRRRCRTTTGSLSGCISTAAATLPQPSPDAASGARVVRKGSAFPASPAGRRGGADHHAR